MNPYKILRQDPEIWDLFTRKEEYNSPLRDKYDRFPSSASKNQKILVPQASQLLVKNGYSIDYPDSAPFAVCLTHDIDNVYQSIPYKGFSALRYLTHGDVTESLNRIRWMRSKSLPLCNFSEIMDIEEKFDARSTFFFMAESPKEQGYSYDIEVFEPDIGEIIDRGWEVGLHGGHTTYNNGQEMQKKKERLEKVTHKPVLGYRNHFLRFRVPDTWEHLCSAGFQYDSTLGYPDCVGFRNGMCHPYLPYNLTLQHQINVIEIPLTIMDGTLDQYRKFQSHMAWDITTKLIDTVEECHGCITFLWHNTYYFNEQKKFYERILNYCADRKAWMTNGKEIADIFKKQDHSNSSL